MFKGLSHDVKIVVISVAVSSLVVGVPAAAAVYANNSDKVDGKHAVGAKASTANRAGKLVATDKQGLLPNDIILQAMDSDLLDGLSSDAFLPAGGTATNSDKLDDKDSTDFLLAGGTAADSELLDGKDSTDFLGADGKALDADKLDGVDSAQFMRGSGYNGATIATVMKGFQATRFVTHDDPTPVGRWRYFCPGDPTAEGSWNYFVNNSSSTTQVYVSRAGSPGTWYQELAPSESMFIRDAAAIGPNGADIYTWTIVNSTMNVVVTGQTTSRRTTDNCLFTARATESAATFQ